MTFSQLRAVNINEIQLRLSWYTQPVCGVGRTHTGICKGTISCSNEIRHEVQSWFSREGKGHLLAGRLWSLQ